MKFKYFLVFAVLMLAHVVAGIYFSGYAWYWIPLTLLLLSLILFLGSAKIGWNFYLTAVNRVPLSFEQLSQNTKPIALTFDDGPHERTLQVLDILKEKNVKATFFIIGKNIAGNESILKRISDEGHLIGNHTFSHEGKFYWQSANKMIKDIKSCNREIEKVIGFAPNIFRPPFGVTNPALAKALDKLELTTVGWTLRSFDTVAKDPIALKNKIVQKAKLNNTILLHDRCEVTVEMLPELIDALKAKGFDFAFPVKIEKH